MQSGAVVPAPALPCASLPLCQDDRKQETHPVMHLRRRENEQIHVGRSRDRCGLCAGLVSRRQRIPVFITASVRRSAGQQSGDRDHQDPPSGVSQRHRDPPQTGAGRAQDPGYRGRRGAGRRAWQPVWWRQRQEGGDRRRRRGGWLCRQPGAGQHAGR
ncbi:hypothetical protein COLO4_02343 [Corchorus olitorius]|uniref:Uncharacterized protein n=1 Tax=Corchorus olitorius TaxID=93759 RepID=A0A1R3L134_9ROSI|nr:hypothetical protein COLO4_02343 [Corchorus olitorius]